MSGVTLLELLLATTVKLTMSVNNWRPKAKGGKEIKNQLWEQESCRMHHRTRLVEAVISITHTS